MSVKKRWMAAGLLSGALAAAGAPLTSGNTAGAMAVTTAHTFSALPVPFVAVGGGARALKDLVRGGLSDGDSLIVCEDGVYKGIRWTGGAWTGVTTVAENGEVTAGDPGAAAPAPGRAVWCRRADVSKPVIVAGLAPAAYGDVAVTPSSDGEAAYTLLANPTGEAFVLNADGAVKGAAKGDMILVSRGAEHDVYTFDGAAWGYDREVTETVTRTVNGVTRDLTVSRTERVTDGTMTVPAGYGFWYVSKGDTMPTVHW